MTEKPHPSSEAPAVSPRLARLLELVNRRKKDIADLVQMGLRQIDLDVDPPAHVPGLEGDARWSDAELTRVANAVRGKYARLQIDLAVTIKNLPIDQDLQIAALLADKEQEVTINLAPSSQAVPTAPVIETVTETAPVLPAFPTRPAKVTPAPPADSSAAATELLKKMGIGVPRKRRPTS